MVYSGKKKFRQSSNRPAQQRLLDVAEELFGEHGFEGTTVREIAAAAGCNIASVNYYFGGKEKLYIEMWRRHLLLMRQTRIAGIDKVMSKGRGKILLEDLLRAFADAFIEPVRDESRSRRFIKLMAREMVDQYLPRDVFLKEMIIPVTVALKKALMLVCPGLGRSEAEMAIISIVGQLIHIVGAKTMFEQTDSVELPRFDLAKATNHIVKFSAAGIRAYAGKKLRR